MTQNKKNQDRIFVEALETRCVVGIFDWERKVKQKVLIDFEIRADVRKAARFDRIEDTIDYKAVSKWILGEVPKTGFRLVESLAEHIARSCLKKFGLREITVRVCKPGAIRHSRNAGVEITRRSAS